MNAVDGSNHYEHSSNAPAPSLLTIILDTNPRAWARLEPTLPLSAAIANLLVFINAHLACNYANKVAVVAAHCHHAAWLYPTPSPKSSDLPTKTEFKVRPTDADGDISMNGRPPAQENEDEGKEEKEEKEDTPPGEEPLNKYRPFRFVEEQLTRNLHALLSSTTPADPTARQNQTLPPPPPPPPPPQ
ncbi:hypothetical protein ACJ72_06857 [Emergomyces africanus]|uniref:General transcription and DNA repair factor IIH subunit TFB4 n=1 Tax=Emergomyces africanus TaxID=1955775 RepID=A0A1B7NPW1_9EURO|nr:hypothetical protein ACJ72_06857 [Emergomyces africanus]